MSVFLYLKFVKIDIKIKKAGTASFSFSDDQSSGFSTLPD
ncbi:hypothetical protein M272_20025 [Vibrio natriegens NBRC 15636 = ATCC 14048 = DSM 759]|nr:hypothetical protein M272_20025 [Vibrio natriegens NBRC 15636 = ATCC 14048 = DSM 759]